MKLFTCQTFTWKINIPGTKHQSWNFRNLTLHFSSCKPRLCLLIDTAIIGHCCRRTRIIVVVIIISHFWEVHNWPIIGHSWECKGNSAMDRICIYFSIYLLWQYIKNSNTWMFVIQLTWISIKVIRIMNILWKGIQKPRKSLK